MEGWREPLKRILPLAVLAVLFAAPALLRAQFAPAESTPVHDPAALVPPPGARVAIFEFADLECPACARANPLLMEAQERYHIPWLRHDFPLPMHVWSFQAAVDARWFDTKSVALGNAFRNAVFADQANIQTQADLRTFAENFAAQHKLALPFVIDPLDKLTNAVKADSALGQRIGISHTPTIWIVTRHSRGAPYMEVTDTSQLFEIIDQALQDTAHAPAHSK
jgi:protein-disulfide isomerase